MSIDPMACECWGCRPDLMAAEYDRLGQFIPPHEMAWVTGTIARLKGELEPVTAERDQARAEADRATQMWSHAEADAQTARPIVRAAQDWRAEISADKTLQEAWGGHPLALAVDRFGELDDINRRVAADRTLIDAAGNAVRSIRYQRGLGDHGRALIAAWDARAALDAPASEEVRTDG